MRRVVIAHGGTGSTPKLKDGTDSAAQAGMKALKDGGPVDAVVAACVVLEDDERFNAGTGSNYRFDGVTIEMDAGVMDSRNRYGAVSGIQKIKNPVRVAESLMDCPNNILGGDGAYQYARKIGHKEYDPGTKKARKKWEEMIEKIKNGEDTISDNEWDYEGLRRSWNYPRSFEEIFGEEPWKPRKGGKRMGVCDTIGAVATDGYSFAAATSTGGTLTTLYGRIGDTPNIGTGIFAGDCGAIVCTGNGDHLVRERAATRIHRWMEEGFSPQAAIRRFTAKFSEDTDLWMGVIGLESHAGGGNREVAWSVETD